MPIITTFNLRNSLAKGLIGLIAQAPGNALYLTIGRQLPWPTEPTAPPPIDSIHQTKLAWDDMIFAKIVTFNNLSLVIPRYNWVSGNVYTAYTDTQSNLPTSQFYIYTSNNEVYKCLANGNGANSTVQPAGLGSASNNYIQTMSDGYQWKYMLQVQPADIFLNSFYFGVPIVPPPNSLQAIIQQASVPGSIDVITVTSGGSNYVNSPTSFIVNISGDGTGATAYANVSNNQVQNIIMTNRGSGYSYANVTFTDPVGTGATAQAIMPPPGGHGAEADTELCASTVMVSTVTANAELGFLTVNNAFREIGLLLNPLEFGSNTVSSNARCKVYVTLVVSGGVGSYNLNETVFQGTSINTSTFSGAVIDFDPIAGVITLNNIVGTPVLNGILYGLSSGTQRYVTNITNPDLELYTGEFLLLDHEPPIQRNPNQQEAYQLLLQF
jgi:hypothetical protein